MAVLKIGDFTGGLQENSIGAPNNQYKRAQNLRINEIGKLETRFGAELDDTNSARHRVTADANGVRRISTLIPTYFGASKTPVLMKQVGQRLYYNNGTSLVNLQGPASTDAFAVTGVDGNTRFAFTKFLGQFIISHDELLQRPLHWYNTSGVPTLRTAGLPASLGQAGATFNGESGSGSSYNYVFVYKYTYVVDGRTFIKRGRPSPVVNRTASTPATSITIPSGMVYSNATGEHYDTANIVIEAYRTDNNGTAYSFAGSRANSAGTLTIAMDTTQILYTAGGVAENWRPPTCKYVHATTGFCYYAHGYEMLASTDADVSTSLLGNRLWQSRPGIHDAVPQDFFADLEEDITGISSVKSIPIVFTQNYVYRVDGTIDSQGRGDMVPKRITEITGCVNHNSIVQTADGVYFAGRDGFYFTNGFTVTELSKQFRDMYATLVDSETKRRLIYGEINVNLKEIFWTCRIGTAEGTDEANAMFVFNINFSQFTGPHTSGFDNYNTDDGTEALIASTTALTVSNGGYVGSYPTVDIVGTIGKGNAIFSDQLPFATFVASTPVIGVTTASLIPTNTGTGVAASAKFVDSGNPNWQYFEQFLPSAIAFLDGYMYRADPRGYTFKEQKTLGTVPLIETYHSNPANWKDLPIQFYYASIDTDLENAANRKYVSVANIKTRFSDNFTSNLSIQVLSENDANSVLAESDIIDEENTDDIPALVDNEVKMPSSNGLRCNYKSLHITNGDVKIQDTGETGIGSLSDVVASNVKIVKVRNMSSTPFPTDALGYYLKFYDYNGSGGAFQYLYGGRRFWITTRVDSDNLWIYDHSDDLRSISLAGGELPNYEIRGFRKGDTLNLQQFEIYYEFIGGSQRSSGVVNSGVATT